MKEIKHYICEICGTEYADKKDAQDCEKGHCAPKEIVKAKFLPIGQNHKGYPESVDILMDNGEILTFKR